MPRGLLYEALVTSLGIAMANKDRQKRQVKHKPKLTKKEKKAKKLAKKGS